MKPLELLPLLNAYLAAHPSEASKLALLSEQSREEPEILTQRSNMRGHATGSVAIVDTQTQCMLEIFHNAIGKWLTPGGHIDAGETPRQAAAREAQEEVAADLPTLLELPRLAPLQGLLDIDTHRIYANPQKKEGAHFHHDFLFAFGREGSYDPSLALEEVSQFRWTPIAFYLDSPDERERRVAEKLCAIFSPRPATPKP